MFPYVPFAQFEHALEALKNVPPGPIHRHSWGKVAGLEKQGSALLSAFRSLRLVSGLGYPLPLLSELVNPSTRVSGLRLMLRDAYPFIKLDALESIGSARLQSLFREMVPGEHMWRKALSFYVKAASAAGIDLHPSVELRERGTVSSPMTGASIEEIPFARVRLSKGGFVVLAVQGQSIPSLAPEEFDVLAEVARHLRSIETDKGREKRPIPLENRIGARAKPHQ